MLGNQDHSRADRPFRLGERGERALGDQRYLEFQRRTAGYLRRAFPDLFQLRTDDEIYEVADLALQRAGAWGRRTERQIWEYLIPMCFLGSYFDADPQFQSMLQSADWQRAEPPISCDIKAMRVQIDNWFPAVTQDYIDIDAVAKSASELYLTAKRRYIEDGFAFSAVENALSRLLPARWTKLPAEARSRWFQLCNRRAEELEFVRADGLAYCVASFHFGFAFERNPIYPWAAQTLIRSEGTNEERMFAFAIEARKHFISAAGADPAA
jgi:hypothetical protein